MKAKFRPVPTELSNLWPSVSHPVYCTSTFSPVAAVVPVPCLISQYCNPVGVVVPAPCTGVGAFGSTLVTGALFLTAVFPVVAVLLGVRTVAFAEVAGFAAIDFVAVDLSPAGVAGFFATGFLAVVAGGGAGGGVVCVVESCAAAAVRASANIAIPNANFDMGSAPRECLWLKV